MLGDCDEKIGDVLGRLGDKVTVVLDPPKSGCADNVVQSLLASCPATLARDVAALSVGFKLVSATPYDMFPQTTAIETLAVLIRK